jgi:hypothetical protein
MISESNLTTRDENRDERIAQSPPVPCPPVSEAPVGPDTSRAESTWYQKAKFFRYSLAVGVFVLVLAGSFMVAGSLGLRRTAQEGNSNETVARLPPIFAHEAGSVKCDFEVKNTSNEPVDIKEIRRSCGCSKATLDKNQLLPGEQTVLHLDSDMRQGKGRQGLSCVLLLDGSRPFHTYSVETAVYPRIQILVQTLTMGKVRPGAESVKEVLLVTHGRSRDDLPQLTSVTSTSRELEVSGPRELEEEAFPDGFFAKRFAVVAKLKAGNVAGQQNAELVFAMRSPGFEGEKRLGVVWNVESSFEIKPARVFFVLRTEEHSASGIVTIRSRDGSPMAITQITTPNPRIRAKMVKRQGSETSFQVEVDPKEVQEPISGDVAVQTNNSTEPVLRVPVTVLSRGSLLKGR